MSRKDNSHDIVGYEVRKTLDGWTAYNIFVDETIVGLYPIALSRSLKGVHKKARKSVERSILRQQLAKEPSIRVVIDKQNSGRGYYDRRR